MITLNNKKLCENCFSETTVDPCPHCGFTKSAYRHDPITLAVGSILNQRYMIGGAIGKGGFGITYLAYDLKLDARLAVKEYYPMGLAIRNPGSKLVTVSNAESEDSFRTGAEKFYNEAKMVARFNGNPNIVSVHDFFYENDTVYFTMGYLQGQTLKSYIRDKKITEGQAVNILHAISGALMASHSLNILHRDVSPDNIMLCDDGTIRLLDFGAARQVMAEQSQSLSVILKQGFAPLEQYQKKGKQGPWTDIYALGATIYTALTGDMLNDPMTRLEDDSDFDSNKHGISDGLWDIIRKCTKLKIQERYQDIPELKQDLAGLNIESEPFNDIKEEITDILRHRMSKPFGSTKETSGNMPNFAPASDPNATMLLDASSNSNLTMSMAEGSTGQPVTGQPITGQPITGQPITGQPMTGQPMTGQPITGQQYTGQPATGPGYVRQAPPKKKGLPVWAIILIIVGSLAVMGGIGYAVISTIVKKVVIEKPDPDPNSGGDDTKGGGEGSSTEKPDDDEITALREIGDFDVDKFVNKEYEYSICYPSEYSVSEIDDETVEIKNGDGSLHVAVRYKDRYVDDSILYDASDFCDMINVRHDNLLPVEGSGNTPDVDDVNTADIAEQEDITDFEYHYKDKKGKTWDGNVYLFDATGQYGCYVVYTLVSQKADDYDDLQDYARACADSFRITGDYDPPKVKMFRFENYGIRFSITDGQEASVSDADSVDGSIHVKYKDSNDNSRYAYVIPGDHFGSDFEEMFTGAAQCLSDASIEIESDMIPLDYGRYKGYYVRGTSYGSDGESEDCMIYAFSTNMGSDAKYQNYVVIGTAADDDRLRDIVGGFRFDGATTADNTKVDTGDTVAFTEEAAVEEDDTDEIFPGTNVREVSAQEVDDFLRNYLEKNGGNGASEPQRRNLCARALCYARNEIYARHGYIFNSGELQNLFNQMSWYEGTTPSDRFNSNVFNAAEKRNIEYLKARMEDYGGYQPAK